LAKRSYSLALYGLLVLSVLYGGYLRFHQITDREPFICDEADYISEALFLKSTVCALRDSVRLFLEERRTGEDVWKKEEQGQAFSEALEGHPPALARPGHVIFIALAMGFVEDPISAAPVASALFGTLTILLVFFLGRVLYQPWVGVLAAVFLAISPYHIWYSRSGFAEADTTCFLVLTMLLYALGHKRSSSWLMALTGLACGTGFVVHHRFVLFLGVLWLLEGFVAVTRQGPEPKAQRKRFCILNAAFLLPILSIEAVYHIALLAFQAAGQLMPCATYLTQLLIVSTYIRYNNLIPYRYFFEWQNFVTYPYLLWIVEGPLVFLFLLGGVASLLKRRGLAGLMVGLLLVGPIVFYSYLNANARFISIVIPFLAIATGLFFVEGVEWASRKGTNWARGACLVAGVLLLLQAGIGLHHTRKLLDWKVGYRETFAWIQENSEGTPRAICSYPHFSQLYLGKEASAKMPSSEEELRERYEEGFRYVVLVDFLLHYLKRLEAPALARLPVAKTAKGSVELARKIAREQVAVHVVPCSFCISPLNILEINLQFRESMRFMESASAEGFGPIRVYDLETYFSSQGD
jgi:hypothetical protein